MNLGDLMILLAWFAVLGTAAVLLEARFKAVERRRGEPAARALHPVTRSKQLPDVDDAGRWVR